MIVAVAAVWFVFAVEYAVGVAAAVVVVGDVVAVVPALCTPRQLANCWAYSRRAYNRSVDLC